MNLARSGGVELTEQKTELVSRRDLALLTAVADNRCEILPGVLPVLFVDGQVCCDGHAARRLIRAGLLARPRASAGRLPARLTKAGKATLG